MSSRDESLIRNRFARALGLALIIFVGAALPASGQVRPELLENSGLTGDRNPAAPVPVRDPAKPQREVPKAR
ncbi:MAG: hypothetical protein JRH01_20090 [Deltaproteobacteria bacterium]|nr:hypothetical protein [Deltaproteobacteria bacterium]MBW2396806.1 hypothetical protein [Deltaproteobacteria bacterium]